MLSTIERPMARARTTAMVLMFWAAVSADALAGPCIEPNPVISQDDVVVYTENVLDFEAKAGDSDFDNTAPFQAAIDRAHANGGGIVYVPAGRYCFASNLVLKTGITLRGEWRDPDVPGQEKAAGSVLAVTADHGNAEGKPFLRLQAGAAVRKMSFWYPKQSYEHPVPYPWTIDASAAGPEVTQVTLYNSYRGIRTAHTEMQIIRLRATCLDRGCHVHGAGNWSWFLDDCYSPKYWVRSALPGSPATDGQAATLRAYMRGHVTAMLFKVSKGGGALADGGNIYDLRVEDAHTALETHWSWFQAVNVHFKNVRVGWHAAPAGGHGRRGGYAKARIVGGVIDVLPGKDTCGVKGNGHGVYLFGVTITGNPTRAVDADRDATLVKCRFDKWARAGVHVTGGTPIVAGCTFGEDADRDIVLGPGVSSAALAGNTFAGKPDIVQGKVSSGVVIDHRPLDIPDLPAWATTYGLAKECKPARPDTFFPVTAFGAKQGDGGKTDCTDAFREALAAAREAGGGTVFVPGGWWRLDDQITVPSGVELRGCGAGMHTMIGTTLFSYAHKGNEKGDPFITLEAESGLRGLIVYYPGMGKSRAVAYPWAIRGAGKGVWVREVRLANPWNGIDLGTHRCDDFMLTRVIGDVRRNAIYVSGGSTGGRIEYTGWWWTGDFKGFPNGPQGYKDTREGEVTTATTWPVRLGHARDVTLLCPNTYQGTGRDAALLSFVNDGGVATEIKVIGPEADAFPFLKASACGTVDIVSAGTYGSPLYASAGEVSLYGTGWIGEVHCTGGRLNLYGVAGLNRLTARRGETRMYGARAVGNSASVALLGSSQATLAACSGLEVEIRTPHEVAIHALARSAVQRYKAGVLDLCDSATGWRGDAIGLDTKNQKEGKACLTATSTSVGGPAGWFSRAFGAIDAGVDEENGVLRLWLYVSDVSKMVKEASIELTSSGTYDRDEYSWNPRALNLKNGWNDLTLAFSKAGKVGKPDLHNIRYFRVYSFLSGPMTRKIDHLRVEKLE